MCYQDYADCTFRHIVTSNSLIDKLLFPRLYPYIKEVVLVYSLQTSRLRYAEGLYCGFPLRSSSSVAICRNDLQSR